MNNHQFELLDNLPISIKERGERAHIASEAESGIVCNYKQFFIVAKDSGGAISGVLTAYTAFAEIYVDDIWVEPTKRGRGIGLNLLAELEEKFRRKGYNNINLVTYAFQAPEFYKKCGFEQEFVRINKHNPKLNKFFFVKYFANQVQTQGIIG